MAETGIVNSTINEVGPAIQRSGGPKTAFLDFDKSGAGTDALEIRDAVSGALIKRVEIDAGDDEDHVPFDAPSNYKIHHVDVSGAVDTTAKIDGD